MEHFTSRGKMSSLLNDMPVAVILDQRAALLGAASMALRL
jgi:glucokinase